MPKPRKKRRLIVDASIIFAASGHNARPGKSQIACDFLWAIRGAPVCVILTDEIEEEWNKYQKGVALTWRADMVAKNKIHRLKRSVVLEDLRDEVRACASERSLADVMIKDVHLIEASLAADRIIISLDDRSANHFARSSRRIRRLAAIMWVNPGEQPETCTGWLKEGARVARAWQLGNRKVPG